VDWTGHNGLQVENCTIIMEFNVPLNGVNI
jgi:hypothetical protein